MFKKILYICLLFVILLLTGCNNVDDVKTTTAKITTTTTVTKEDKLIETSTDIVSLGAIRYKEFTYEVYTDSIVKLKIEDESIATFTDTDGLVQIKSIKEGITNLNFYIDDEIIKTIEIRVERQFITFPLAYNTVVLKGKNKEATVKAILMNEIEGVTPIWTVSDESLVSIETQGIIVRITSKAKGICYITLTYGDYEETICVKVTNIRGDL